MRILFFGMMGTLSRLPLAALMAAKYELCGLVLPAEIVPPFQLVGDGRSHFQIIPIRNAPPVANLLPTQQAASPLAMAAAQGVPAFAVRHLAGPETLATLAACQPDLICVSCFPRRLPPAILDLPALGCLNVHPSLLPKFRGPAPLFWTLRAGARQAGVTIHFMDENFDTGDVALQRPFPLEDGATHEAIETSLAEIGGELLVEAVQKLAVGELPRQPQPAGFKSESWPQDGDFALEIGWTAQRAFNFMRGTANWKRPYSVAVNGEVVWLETAVSFEKDAQLPTALTLKGSRVEIQFSAGVLTAVLAA